VQVRPGFLAAINIWLGTVIEPAQSPAAAVRLANTNRWLLVGLSRIWQAGIQHCLRQT
jgi:hypothetical protein